jgi:glycerate dehydrogenase
MKGVLLDSDSLWPDDLDLSGLFGTLDEWQRYPSTNPDQVAQRISNAEVVVTNKVVLGAEQMDCAANLRLIAVTATGVNNIDLEAARVRNIQVCNVPAYGTASVSQHTFTLILALCARLTNYLQDVADGQWQKSSQFCLLDYPSIELKGKTLGIIGYGELGKQVAELGRAFGMSVLVAESQNNSSAATVSRTPLDELIETVDVLSLHCLLSPQTEKIINAERLSRMKKSALLINTARGGLIDEAALAKALRTGEVAGAGLDVLSAEPPAVDHPLLSLDIHNLLITPHCAWGSCEARQRLIDIVARNIGDFRAGNPINLVSIDP